MKKITKAQFILAVREMPYAEFYKIRDRAYNLHNKYKSVPLLAWLVAGIIIGTLLKIRNSGKPRGVAIGR